MRNAGQNIILLLLLGVFWISSCERIEPESTAGQTGEMISIPSPRMILMDTLQWRFVEQSGSFYFFELGSDPQIPSKGDLLVYHSSEHSFFGRLTGTDGRNALTGLEIELVSLNTLYSFLAFRDTLRSFDPEIHTYLHPLVRSNGDSLVIENTQFEVRESNVLIGYINVDSLRIVEQGSGETYLYLTPEWEKGTKTREAKLSWNQDLQISGALNYFSVNDEALSDSMLLRTREFESNVGGFPILIRIQEYLTFEWSMDGTKTIGCVFSFGGETKALASSDQGDSWIFAPSSSYKSQNLDLVKWDLLHSGYLKLGYKTFVEPIYCGIGDTRIVKNIQLEMTATASWPNWQVLGKLSQNDQFETSSVLLSDLNTEFLEQNSFSADLLTLSGVLENESPTADFSITPGTGYSNTDFKFNASGSSDKEDSFANLEVRWDFNGDGIWDTQFSKTKFENHRYLISGLFNVRMEVRDSQGASAIATKELTVYATTSAPIASFTIFPEKGKQADFFTFDASGCYDAEDPLSVLEVRWDFQNDGIWDTHFSTRKAEGWIYGITGVFVVKLEVRDSDGLTGSTTRLLEVTAANIKPEAYYVVNPEKGTTATRFDFDASGSTDEEDPTEDLSVRWDWENDGVWDTELRTLKTVTHQFETAGNYVVVLQVFDLGGFSNVYSKTIVVTNPNTPPVADFTIDPKTGTTSTKFTFDASISTDAEDALELLEVRWDWTNDDVYSEFTTEKTVTRQFDQPGPYIIKVQVRDTEGLISTKARVIVITE